MTRFDLIISESDAAMSLVSLAEPEGGAASIGVFSLESSGWIRVLDLIPESKFPLVVIDQGAHLGRIVTVVEAVKSGVPLTVAFGSGYEGLGERLSSLVEALGTGVPVELRSLKWGEVSIPAVEIGSVDPDTAMVVELALLARRTRRSQVGRRVGFLGPLGEKMLGGGVVVHRLEDVDRLRVLVQTLDYVVVDAEHPDRDAASDVVEDSSARLLVVGSAAVPDSGRSGDLVVTTYEGPGSDRFVVRPAIDQGSFNPTGLLMAADKQFLFLVEGSGFATPAVFDLARRRVEGHGVSMALVNDLANGRPSARPPGVVLVPDGFSSAAGFARCAMEVAGTGLPVLVSHLSSEAVALLGDELSDRMLSVTGAELLERDGRELRSVEQRRVVLRDHTYSERWNQVEAELGVPTLGRELVSVVVATNRPRHLQHVVEQVRKQNYPNLECVFVLHGSQFDADVEQKLVEQLEIETTVLRGASELVLGDLLNAGVAASNGSLIAKMDDDDYYGADHIWDLVLARSYSHASLVGKAAEFVYLAEEDVTIRRFVGGAESPTATIGGGAFLVGAADLRTVGGFRRLSVGEDRAVIRDLISMGGSVWRTHGFGYVLNRHGVEHSWQTPNSYFADQAASIRQGSDFGWAGV